jgi:photosynthetic reaction center H subunit
MYGTIIGTIDVAQVALYAFWIFFFGLVVWLQRENMREGYPLLDEDGNVANRGIYPLPSPKTFKLPHDGGSIQVPDFEREMAKERDVPMRRTEAWDGAPLEPTGDPLADGVGPASWVQRADKPDLTAHGEVKIRPLASLGGWSLAVPRSDPRGYPAIGGDGKVGGTVKDLWVDQGEHLIRYLEIELPEGAGTRLVPMTLARIWGGKVKIHSLYAEQFAGVPTPKASDQITLLEEDKIAAYWCGGKLYADRARQEPAL